MRGCSRLSKKRSQTSALCPHQRQLLGQRQRQPAREHLARAAHRRAAVDQDVVQRARDLVLALVAVVQQVVGQRLQHEHVVVVRQLAGQQRVDVSAPLDRGVAVDREALRAPGGAWSPAATATAAARSRRRPPRPRSRRRETGRRDRPRCRRRETGRTGAPRQLDLLQAREQGALLLAEALDEGQRPGGIVDARQLGRGPTRRPPRWWAARRPPTAASDRASAGRCRRGCAPG